MQKLVTIDMKAADDREVREHLEEYLRDGWHVVNMTAAGAGQETYRSFLIAVVLERP